MERKNGMAILTVGCRRPISVEEGWEVCEIDCLGGSSVIALACASKIRDDGISTVSKGQGIHTKMTTLKKYSIVSYMNMTP